MAFSENATFLIDGESLSGGAPKVSSDCFIELERLGLLSGAEKTLGFCGFISFTDSIRQKQLIVCGPKTSLEIEGGLDLSLLYRALDRYSGKKPPSAEADGDYFHTKNIASIAREILKDWIINGEWREEIINSRKNSGQKINWTETFKKVMPVASGSGFFYPDLYYRNISSYQESLIHLIHLEVLNECGSTFFWTLTKNPIPFSAVVTGLDPEAKISLLRRQLRVAYSDRSIRLLKLMISFIENGSGTETVLFGTSYFDRVWEQALKSVFCNVKGEDVSMPGTQWVENRTETRKEFVHELVPDFFIKTESGAKWIVDAKYYDYSRNLPHGYDLIKQFFYAKYLADNKEDIKRNIFLLPTGMGEMKIINSSQLFFRGRRDESYREIECFLVPLVNVLDAYVSGEVSDLERMVNRKSWGSRQEISPEMRTSE